MKKEKLKTIQWILLVGMAIVAALTVFCAVYFSQSVKSPLYDKAVDAAYHMQACMDAIKEEKSNRGIDIVLEDTFNTGIIGEEYNFITTTDGDLGAKRTAADANMAAVVLFMLDEAGVKAGDNVGCNFSGSFPSLNIATICACEALGAKPVYLSSCGASTWGANNPEFAFPEMADYLYKNGLIGEGPVLVTPGGNADIAKGIADAELFDSIWERVSALGYQTMVEDDFATNIAAKKQLLDSYDITCFVAVGGNITTFGKNDVVTLLGEGNVKEHISTVNDKSGLIELYLHEDKPTVFLLNIKKIAANFGLPFDPQGQMEPGKAPFYYEKSYISPIIFAGLILEVGLLLAYKLSSKNKEKIS